MRTIYAAALAATVLTMTASATTVSCGTNVNTTPANATTATANVACGGVSAGTLAGNVITSITMYVKGSFDDSAIPAYNGQVRFTFAEDSAQLTITIIGDAPVGSTSDIGSTGVLSATQGGLSLASLSAFNVAVTEQLLSGGRLPANSNVTVSYDYTASAVPEPSTYAMIAMGLAGLGFYRRKLQ